MKYILSPWAMSWAGGQLSGIGRNGKFIQNMERYEKVFGEAFHDVYDDADSVKINYGTIASKNDNDVQSQQTKQNPTTCSTKTIRIKAKSKPTKINHQPPKSRNIHIRSSHHRIQCPPTKQRQRRRLCNLLMTHLDLHCLNMILVMKNTSL